MFTNPEKSHLIMGLQMQICLMETGSVYLRAKDVKAGHKGEIKALDSGQMRMILDMEATMEKIINAPTLP